MRFWPTKRRWKQLAIGFVSVIALVVAADGFMVWRTDARLAAKIAEIRAAGDPASIADLAPKPIPAEQNAAAYIENLTPRLDEFDRELAHFYDKTHAGKAYRAAVDRNEAPTAEQLAAIRAILDKYPDVESGIAAASGCQQYASLADFSLSHQQLLEEYLGRIQKIRTMARFAAWRMEVLAADGQTDKAVQLATQVLELARLFNSEPLLVSYMVGVAVRMTVAQPMYDALATGNVSPETMAALDQELALQDDPDQLLHVLKTEQALGVSYASENGVFEGEHVNHLLVKLLGWPVKSMFVDALGAYDEYFALAGKPWYMIRDRFDANGVMKPAGQGVMRKLLEPAMGAAFTSEARNEAIMRSLRIFNALTQYRVEHGREASGLEDLALPKEATVDPFSGQPLKLKHTDDGWIIYSVETNGVDDDGDLKDQNDVGLAPRKWRAGE